MTFTELCNQIFVKVVNDYHLRDDVNQDMLNPYDRGTIEYDLYVKTWIDAVQWHLEDIIRNPHINPIEALEIKRRISSKGCRTSRATAHR